MCPPHGLASLPSYGTNFCLEFCSDCDLVSLAFHLCMSVRTSSSLCLFFDFEVNEILKCKFLSNLIY